MYPLETFPEHLYSITPENWQKLFQYLPEFNVCEEDAEWHGTLLSLRRLAPEKSVIPSVLVTNILQALYELELIISFDWTAWEAGSRRLAEDPFFSDDLDPVTICKMITGIVRSDRFHQGSLVNAFGDGRMPALLRSLEAKIFPGGDSMIR